MQTKTFYHVAGPKYETGQDLLCWDRLEAIGLVDDSDWQWGDHYIDTDVVCLYESRDEAEQHMADFRPDGTLLKVEIPQWMIDERIVMMTRVDEGFPAVVGKIDSELIVEV